MRVPLRSMRLSHRLRISPFWRLEAGKKVLYNSGRLPPRAGFDVVTDEQPPLSLHEQIGDLCRTCSVRTWDTVPRAEAWLDATKSLYVFRAFCHESRRLRDCAWSRDGGMRMSFVERSEFPRSDCAVGLP
jgi:hypothetical protein